MATATVLTLDQFLQRPETEPASEFFCGRVVEKPMPTFEHALLTSRLVALFSLYLMRTPVAFVLDNLRHTYGPEQRAYLPDVSVLLRDRAPRSAAERHRGPVDIAPDIAIEVTSPDDRPGQLAEKLAFYLRIGIPLVWIVDPEERTLTAYRQDQPATIHAANETITAGPVLPGFQLALADLFDVLDEGIEE